MNYVPADTIVKSYLLNRGYPMHWYLQGLKYAADCIMELRARTLRVVKTAIVTADAGGAIDYPCDYSQIVRIGYANGQKIVPFVQGRGLFNRVQSKDTDGKVKAYGDTATINLIGTWFGSGTNEFGEFKGGIFGHGAGNETNIYEDIAERRQFQLREQYAGQNFFLDYVPDSNHCDSMTRIRDLAIPTVLQYITWKLKENNRTYSKGEAKDEERMYYNQERLLRAQLNPISTNDILRIGDRHYHRSIKH